MSKCQNWSNLAAQNIHTDTSQYLIVSLPCIVSRPFSAFSSEYKKVNPDFYFWAENDIKSCTYFYVLYCRNLWITFLTTIWTSGYKSLEETQSDVIAIFFSFILFLATASAQTINDVAQAARDMVSGDAAGQGTHTREKWSASAPQQQQQRHGTAFWNNTPEITFGHNSGRRHFLLLLPAIDVVVAVHVSCDCCCSLALLLSRFIKLRVNPPDYGYEHDRPLSYLRRLVETSDYTGAWGWKVHWWSLKICLEFWSNICDIFSLFFFFKWTLSAYVRLHSHSTRPCMARCLW